MDTLIGCQQALVLLTNGIQVVSTSSKTKSLFIAHDDNIKVVSQHATYRVTYQDFLDLFQHESFAVYEIDDFDADFAKKKDEEYYSWKHK